MDFQKILARARLILTTPRSEWPVIATEPDTVSGLYTRYILWLAAIPPIFHFIRASLIGYGGFGFHYHVGIATGIGAAIVQYALSLGLVFVVALIINALASNFGGQKNQVQALKAIGYAYTAYWVASIFQVVPWIGWLVVIAGGIYSIYLLYLGLPHTMKCPPEKAGGYTAVIVIISIILSWILAWIVAGIIGASAMTGAAVSSGNGNVSFDKDSRMGKLEAWSKRMEAASKKMDQAQQSGDDKARNDALGQMMGAAMGNDGKVEALPPQRLKVFLPETLGGLKRSDYSAERNGAMGMQFSEAHASYRGDQRSLKLEITDMGGARGLLGLAGWAGSQSEREDSHGYEKTYRSDGRLAHEKWNNDSHSGEYGLVIGDRFMVKVSGDASDIDSLKSIMAQLDLAGLTALRNEGVDKGTEG